MTVNDALKQGNSILFFAEVETPVLDATILLADSLGMTKEKLYATLTDEIDPDTFGKYRESLDKRCSGCPVSYILKRKEFYGIEFLVDERVLVPRPDTETLIDAVLGIARLEPNLHSLIDVCTGSGCIAITLKKLMPALDVTASDISNKALEVFGINSRKILGCNLDAKVSDLLSRIEGSFDFIVSNPPYIKSDEVGDMKKLGWPEPALALEGGAVGIEVTEALIVQAKEKCNPSGWLVLESAPQHMNSLAAMFEREGFSDIRVIQDLGNRDRVIAGKNR